MENKPIPDAELAEVKRLVAAATPGKGEMMEDILRDVRAMISGNKQLRTAFRTMQAERDQLRATVAGLRRALEAGKADRWAATVGNTETNAFAPSPWVLMAETALAASPDEHEAALAEARKDGERLDWLARRTHWVDERMHLGLRGAIDAARGAK